MIVQLILSIYFYKISIIFNHAISPTKVMKRVKNRIVIIKEKNTEMIHE